MRPNHPLSGPKASHNSVQRRIPRKTARILLIDDDPECCRTFKRMLETLGFSTITAASGIEGLEQARDFMPDIVLLDLYMPRMSGFEVLRVLHSAEQTRHIPVLCFTGAADPAGLLQDASLGRAAFGFLRKPFTKEELSAKVERGLLTVRKTPPAEPCRILHRGPIQANREERKVWIGDRPLALVGNRQFSLLWTLMRQDSPIPFMEILSAVWKDKKEDLTKVRMAVTRLRRTLAAANAPCRIETVGHSYQFVLDGA